MFTKKRKASADQGTGAHAVRPRRPGPRGWAGRGGGASTFITPAPEFRGTTVQVCGLWPWSVGAGSPVIGVPLGRHTETGATFCCDPISWFSRARLISNPGLFILGLTGRGKSTLVRRMCIGLAGFGVTPLVVGDCKPDYVEMIRELGGQVITLGRGRGHLNVLDPGEARSAADKLRAAGFEREAQEVEADAHGRQLTMVLALLTILRKQPLADVEESILDQALRVLDRDRTRVPVLGDLLDLIRSAPLELREVAVDRGDIEVYRATTKALEASLISLVRGGRLGDTFSKPTDNPMQMDRPVVYDVSAVAETDSDLLAALLLACWSNGFATVNIANVLADCGLQPRRHYFVVMDELWRALRAGSGVVDRIDALTRLNRTVGVGTAMITHTMGDLEALASEQDKMKARGFVERAGMVICGGLPSAEMPKLTQVIRLSAEEQRLLTSWQDAPAWDSNGENNDPPGLGNFLAKVGGRPGIPFHVELTEAERSGNVHDTNQLWHS